MPFDPGEFRPISERLLARSLAAGRPDSWEAVSAACHLIALQIGRYYQLSAEETESVATEVIQSLRAHRPDQLAELAQEGSVARHLTLLALSAASRQFGSKGVDEDSARANPNLIERLLQDASVGILLSPDRGAYVSEIYLDSVLGIEDQFVIDPPVTALVIAHKDSGLFTCEIDELGVNAYGESAEDLLEVIGEYLQLQWDDIAMEEDDSKLALGAKELKYQLRARVHPLPRTSAPAPPQVA